MAGISRQVIRVDAGSQLRLGLTRNVPVARIRAATLAIRRAGTEDTPVTLQAAAVTDDWLAVFDLPDTWLSQQPPGRYEATLTSACGVVTFQLQKGQPVRAGAQYVLSGTCGDTGAVCEAVCPGGVLTFVPLGTEGGATFTTETGLVLVR